MIWPRSGKPDPDICFTLSRDNVVFSVSKLEFMRSLSPLFFLTVVLAGLLSSCKKTEEYVPVPYECKCGSMNWRGKSFDLLDANYILADSTVMLSRQYYITADVKGTDDILTHTVSMTLKIDDVGTGLFYMDSDGADFLAVVYERDDNAVIRPRRTYRPVQGIVQVSPAFIGGTEPVQFNLILREVDDSGNFVGFEFSFTGSFKVKVG